jgi:hypothetical protein
VPCAGCICGLRVPFENGELRIAALNHKPVNRIAGYCSADFTSEFLKRCHEIPIVSKAPGHIVTPPVLLKSVGKGILEWFTYRGTCVIECTTGAKRAGSGHAGGS